MSKRKLKVVGEMRCLMGEMGYDEPVNFMQMLYKEQGRTLENSELDIVRAVASGADVVIYERDKEKLTTFLGYLHFVLVAKYLMYEQGKVNFYMENKERITEHGILIREIHKSSELPNLRKLLLLLNFKYPLLTNTFLVGRFVDKVRYGHVLFENLTNHQKRLEVSSQVFKNLPIDIGLVITLQPDHDNNIPVMRNLLEYRERFRDVTIHEL